MDPLIRKLTVRQASPLLRLLAFVPLAYLVLTWPGPVKGLAAWEWGVLGGAGLLLWTWIEYSLHRFAFHWVPRSKRLRRLQSHLEHHARPDDPRFTVASLAFSLPVTLAVWGVLVAVAGWERGAVVTTGAILGYLFYEVVHFSTHFSRLEAWPFRSWREHHFEHHRHAGRCFGFTTPLWDLLFATGRKPRAR
jgi:dihydroceramide fatty acyl 2-hydroxylase